MVRGFKIVLLLTLACVQIHHAGIDVGLGLTHSPRQRRKVCLQHRDGQGESLQGPVPHCVDKCHRMHQSALVGVEELDDGMMDLDVSDL